MAEEIAFENERISNFERAHGLDLAYHHASLIDI